MREAPSRALMEAVWAAGGWVRAYDPEAAEQCRRLYGDNTALTTPVIVSPLCHPGLAI